MLYHHAGSFIFHASICFFFRIFRSSQQISVRKVRNCRRLELRSSTSGEENDEIHIELVDNFKVIQVACKGKLVEIERVSPQWSTSFQKVINALKCPTCTLIWHSPVEFLEAVGKLGRAGTEFCKTALKFHMI